MRVRIKTGLLAALGALALGSVAGAAGAQCNTGCTPPPPACCQPPPPPPTPPQPPVNCCQAPPPPNGNFNSNFNLNVNVNANANANSNANANASSAVIRARGAASVYVGGAGGAYFSVDQPYPTVIQGLNVEGGGQLIQRAVERSRWASSRMVIQAMCIDDRDIPHPASQVQPGREIAEGYNGELYRCIAGTRLQYTLAEFAEQISFDHGQTMTCRKGESLWYSEGAAAAAADYAAAQAAQYGGEPGPGGPIGGGVVECRPQTPERDCNERSLLRRYGAGIKILTLWRQETYTEYEQEVVQASSMSIGSSLTLDGGVGGRVF